MTAVFLFPLPIALLIAGLLLWRYRRAVRRALKAGPKMGEEAPVVIPAVVQVPPDRSLEFSSFSRADRLQTAVNVAFQWRCIQWSIRRTALVHVLAGAVFAIVVGWLAWLPSNNNVRLGLAIGFGLLWPTLGTLMMTRFGRPATRWALVVAYFLMPAALFALFFDSAQSNRLHALIGYMSVNMVFVVFPTLLFFVMNIRRVRAVAPQSLAAILTATGLLAFGYDYAKTIPGLHLEDIFPRGLFWVIGPSTLAVMGYLAFRAIGRRYRDKRTSDEIVRINAWFWTFAVLLYAQFKPIGASGNLDHLPRGIAEMALLMAVLSFSGAFYLGLRFCAARRSALTSLPLLLIPARDHTRFRRGEKFLESLERRWRHAGPIHLLEACGPGKPAVACDEYLDYVAQRGATKVVTDESQLEERLATLDTASDPDCRFRINRLLCDGELWMAAVKNLAACGTAVLVDLRHASANCPTWHTRFECLLDFVPLNRLVFLLDCATDRPSVEDRLKRHWTVLSMDSPNRILDRPTIHFFNVDAQGWRDVDALVRLLLEATNTVTGQCKRLADPGVVEGQNLSLNAPATSR